MAEIVVGVPVELAPGVVRLTAPNPGMMTGPGTNTYLLGDSVIAVIDPGPPMQQHIDSIVAAAAGSIEWILVTHTHPDHSPGAAMLAAATGARLVGLQAPGGPHQDRSFAPDHEPRDGELLQIGEVELQCIHTPGHASNHVCYLQKNIDWLYTGDHIMNGSTVVIDPPDGSMKQYLESLQILLHKNIGAIAPGHGDVLEEPGLAIRWIIDHRLEREAKVIDALVSNPDSTTGQLVSIVYREVDPRLHMLAERSLLAHLIKLNQDARATVTGDRWKIVQSE